MKKTVLSLFYLTLFAGAFSQSFEYTFENQKINLYLNEHKIENAFNILLCVETEDEYSCSNIFGEIKYNSKSKQYYYRSGKMAYKVEFVNNMRVLTTYYHNSDSIFSITEFNGRLLWNIKLYSKDGQLLEIGDFKDGTGLLKYYRQNGTMSAKENYYKGKLHGNVELYYSNGSLMLEGQFKDGDMIGACKEFFVKIE